MLMGLGDVWGRSDRIMARGEIRRVRMIIGGYQVNNIIKIT